MTYGFEERFDAVRVDDREENAVRARRILTKNGCGINVRLGPHDDGGLCLPGGTLIPRLSRGTEGAKSVVDELKALKGVKAQFIDLD